jgi:hypothetical protein
MDIKFKLTINKDKINKVRKFFGLKTKKEETLDIYRQRIGIFYTRFLTVEQLNDIELLKNLNSFLVINVDEDSSNLAKELAFYKWKKQYRL